MRISDTLTVRDLSQNHSYENKHYYVGSVIICGVRLLDDQTPILKRVLWVRMRSHQTCGFTMNRFTHDWPVIWSSLWYYGSVKVPSQVDGVVWDEKPIQSRGDVVGTFMLVSPCENSIGGLNVYELVILNEFSESTAVIFKPCSASLFLLHCIYNIEITSTDLEGELPVWI